MVRQHYTVESYPIKCTDAVTGEVQTKDFWRVCTDRPKRIMRKGFATQAEAQRYADTINFEPRKG